MARRKIGLEPPRRSDNPLVARLADELNLNRDSGQPLILEQEFPSGQLRVIVFWDAWEGVSMEERSETILRAYAKADNETHWDTIALANGLTMPEAHAAGMLPFQVIPALRKTDTVTLEQCREPMIAEGASDLGSPGRPQLRFSTLAEAEAAITRLGRHLPASEPVWTIAEDYGRVEA